MRLYHATAAGHFSVFDFARSSGCVWFITDREEARRLALSFARWRSPNCPYVYECEVHFARLATFQNEGDIYAFAKAKGARPGYEKPRASLALLEAGYDGIVDNYDGKRSPSYAALRPGSISVVRAIPV